MKDLCVIPKNEVEHKKILAFLLKHNIERQDADDYVEENTPEREECVGHVCECDCDNEPVLLVDAIKEELWERVRCQYTVEQLEEIFENH